MKAHAMFMGKVTRSAKVDSKSGKVMACLNLEGTPVIYGEKSFSPRVEAVSYRNVEMLVALEPGTWVEVIGEAEARTYDYQGKAVAKLVITGEITPLDRGQPAPPRSPAKELLPLKTASATTKAAEPEEDDVPF